MRLRIIFLACLAILLASDLTGAAQGTFVFNNNNSTAITNPVTGGRATGFTVALYFNTDTNAASNYSLPMMLNTNAITNLAFPGLFFGGTRTIPGAPTGSYVAVEVRAWSDNYADWDSAYTAWNCGFNVLIGQSYRFVLGALGGGGNPVPTLTMHSGLLNAFFVYPNTATPYPCSQPRLAIVPDSSPIRLRIDANDQLRGMRFQIQANTTLATNGWQVLTNLFPQSFPVYWTDPQATNSPRYYRIWVRNF